MNSAQDISKYGNHNNNYYWPFSGNENTNYPLSHKSPKKDKKWTFGNIFRRKKKNDSDSTSEDEYKKKKKSNSLPKTNNSVGFDRIIQTNSTNNNRVRNIFSEPDCNGTQNFISASEITRPSRKCKRDGVKARAEARIRDNSRGEGSSEEDSPFKSDESSTSSHRKSRAARTQRYLRRHSKDTDIHLSQSDELWKPHAFFSGLCTIPPSHKTVSSNKSSSFCDYDTKNKLSVLNNQRSISCDGNIHHRTGTPSTEAIVIHAQVPLEFPTNMFNYRVRAAPPPPPRDPNRLINMSNGETRPISYSFDHKTNSDQHLHQIHHRINTNHSTSEDQLSVLLRETVPKPPSMTPNDYRYLTDKNPRSRKPICVMQPNSFDFWREKEENVTSKSPIMFTAKTLVSTNIFSQPENSESLELPKTTNLECNILECDVPKRQQSPFRIIENEVRKSTNLEEALDELEAIYKSLHLGDEELLDRAAERESPKEYGLKPKIKIEPDPKSDDMAYRKFCKERSNSGNDSISPGSYLLSSPVFGGNTTAFNKNIAIAEPDITFDDVVYRNVKHTNNTLKIIEPQPPFGIPVGPVLPSANSDYLHATPLNYKKSKKMPDVVKDDLAYRNLRKDSNKEPALPKANVSREDYLNNNYRKKRAVRSLSANISNIMYQNHKLNVFKDSETEQNIDDVADALEVARQILKNEEDKINATRKAFMSDGELKNNKFRSSKAGHCKLEAEEGDHLTVDSKPPRLSNVLSPVCSNLLDEDVELEKALQHSTLEELLTSLARETSEHIAYGLSAFDEPISELKAVSEKQKYSTTQPSGKVLPSIDIGPFEDETAGSLVVDTEIDNEEHDYVNIESSGEEQFAIMELNNSHNKFTGSDVKGSNDLEASKNFVGAKLGGEECVNAKYIALPTNSCTYVNQSSFKFDTFDNCNNVRDLTVANSSVFNKLTSSLTQLVTSSIDIELSSFPEIKSNTTHLFINDFDLHFAEGQNVYPLETVNSTLSNETCNKNKMTEIDNSHLNLENAEETTKIVHQESESNLTEFKLGPFRTEQRQVSHIDTNFDSLESPKLVQNLNSVCSNENTTKLNDHTDLNLAVSNNSWYDDPSVIAIACSCGIACSYQFPFDIIATLGLLFALISMLLAIITRI